MLSCAHPMPPGGGPIDETPPRLVAAEPESAATGMGPVTELRFAFSEKMDRADASRWLQTFPRRTARSTRWQGARLATVQLDEPLPADTVVVVELLPGMKDNHGVPQPRGRRWAIATGDSLPDGEISGQLILDGKPVIGGMVELLPAGPDTVMLAQRQLLRRTETDSLGAYRLRWLPASGERWLLRTYDDRSRDRRPGENEAQRLWPDTLRLVSQEPRLDLGIRTIYQPTTPGQLAGRLAKRPDLSGPVRAIVLKIAEEDTGFAPAPQPATAKAAQALPDTGRFVIEDAGPGLVRAVFFVDHDGDSLLSAIPLPADTLWALEPWALLDSLLVEPGLPQEIPAPVWPDTLTPWAAPPPAASDTTASAPDTLGAAPPDTVFFPAPPDTAVGGAEEP